MSDNYYKPGAHNVICERTGFKVKSTDVRKEWTGKIVRKESWEARHPQDFIRAIEDSPGVRDARPPQEEWFVGTNEVTPESL